MTNSPKQVTLDHDTLTQQFDALHSLSATIVITLGTPQDRRQLIRSLRRQGATLGRRMQKLARANLKHPSPTTLSDPDVPRTLTEDDFLRELRKCVWDCLEQLGDTKTMDPHQRLALLRRRLWMRGRRLELISSRACIVDRDELLRIIAEGERRLLKTASKRT
jgi:hypothetical protein